MKPLCSILGLVREEGVGEERGRRGLLGARKRQLEEHATYLTTYFGPEGGRAKID